MEADCTCQKIQQDSAQSDEKYRLIKMMEKKNGMTEQNLLDEGFDNGDDENCTIQELYFENKKLKKMYNNGNVMTEDDRKSYLTLDSSNKSKKKNTEDLKGNFGYGAAAKRTGLAPYGKEITTSRDSSNMYQVEIDLEKLTNDEVPNNCSNQCLKCNPNLPNGKEIELYVEKYKKGVTTSNFYSKKKNPYEWKLEDLIIHIALKYNSKIKQGTKYIIYWDDKKYTVPDIYTEDIVEDVYKLNVYSSDKIISMKNNVPELMYKKEKYVL